MSVTLLRAADYVENYWSGGSTCQIAIFPPTAVYADRDFIWRLSSATVELADSDFTPLPDYQRLIATLSGEIKLAHDEGEAFTLSPFVAHAFDGGVKTHSQGQCTDFNVMLRKQACSGNLQALQLAANTRLSLSPAVDSTADKSQQHYVFLYCYRGSVQCHVSGQTLLLETNETLVLNESDASQLLELQAQTASELMLAKIQLHK